MFTLKLLSGWNPWLFVLLAVVLAVAAWVLYRRELRPLGLGIMQWILPLLRSLAILLIVLTLAEPAIESRHREGEPGHVHFLIDGSNSMSIADQTEGLKGETINRFQRAISGVTTPDSGVCAQISDQFDVSIWRADATNNVLLWKSALQSDVESLQKNELWSPTEWSAHTALGDRLGQLREQIANSKADSDSTKAQSIIVLLSDGQNNFGSSTQQAADDLAKSKIPVASVGFGPENQQSDLVLKAFEAPQRLFKTDQLSGRIVIADTLKLGTAYEVQILQDDKVVWHRSLHAIAEQQRELLFDLSMEDLYKNAMDELPKNIQYNSLPIKLTAKLVTSISEQSTENNQLDAHISMGASKAQILLVDGRSRWETRYVKNLFSRDPAWEITTVIAEDENAKKLPQTRAEWQAYHLVILGDVPTSLCDANLQSGLVDFVNRGGGLIVSDGARRHLHSIDYSTLASLLPVRLQSSEPTASNAKWGSQLTLVGQRLSALNLMGNPASPPFDEIVVGDRNSQFWKQLPKLEFVQQSKLATGSETLVEATHNGQSQPLIVGRRFGAGQVLYIASDETWRWRFKVADQIHQRLWNQLARWVMRKPMSVESEFLSLETGSASHAMQTPIEIRAALRQPNGDPAENRRTVAIISRDGEVVTRVNLVADESNPGFYSSSISELPVGEYQVSIEAEGFTKEALAAKSAFAVIQSGSSSELLSTSCDSASLQSISQSTGGRYLHESRLDQLPELLRPLSGGKFVHSTRLIWQSYYWFFAALALLAIEWVLRKRAGLI